MMARFMIYIYGTSVGSVSSLWIFDSSWSKDMYMENWAI